MRPTLKLPSTLVVAVLAAAPLVGCDDEDPPKMCTLEGICPDDGRVCFDEQTAEVCCPVCPADGVECPAGCVLEFPPV